MLRAFIESNSTIFSILLMLGVSIDGAAHSHSVDFFFFVAVAKITRILILTIRQVAIYCGFAQHVLEV